MSNQPNWEEAPEGATHYLAVASWGSPWFADVRGTLLRFHDKDKVWFLSNFDVGDLNNGEFIERPTVNQQLTVPAVKESLTTEWNGTGLPPIGICESIWTSPDEYYKVKVITHDDGEAVFRWIDGPDKGAISSSKNGAYGGLTMEDHYIFRPIQPIKSDRDRWIDAAFEVVHHVMVGGKQELGKLYDAGLAKLPEQK